MDDEVRAIVMHNQRVGQPGGGRHSVPLWELRFGIVDCDPHDTPLWELLPRDIQEHIGRFLAQKMLWIFLSFGTPTWLHHRMNEDEFMRIVNNMRRACPTFHRTLRTVHHLGIPVCRWNHHEIFARGLVRLAWEYHDREQMDAQGVAHISKCWVRPDYVMEVTARGHLRRRLTAIAKQAYESGRSSVLPMHYLQVIEQCVHEMMLEDRALRWVHGQERKDIEKMLLIVVNAPWNGRTVTSELRNKKVLQRGISDALNSLRCAQQA